MTRIGERCTVLVGIVEDRIDNAAIGPGCERSGICLGSEEILSSSDSS